MAASELYTKVGPGRGGPRPGPRFHAGPARGQRGRGGRCGGRRLRSPCGPGRWWQGGGGCARGVSPCGGRGLAAGARTAPPRGAGGGRALGLGFGPRAMAAREGQKGRAEGKGHRAAPDSAWSLPEPFPNARSSARGRRHRQPPREVLLRQLPAASLCEAGRAGGRERGRERGREGGREGGRLLVGREGLPVPGPPGRGTAQGRSGSARCLCEARERGACPTAPQTNERGRGTSWIRSWTSISTSWLCNGVAGPVLA